MKKILSIFVILCVIFNTNAYAEKFTGTVRDETETLIGAYVKIPNTNPHCACKTDTDGNFNLTCNSTLPSDAVLEITYIGYTKQTIPLKNFKSGQTINMVSASKTMNELDVNECANTHTDHPGAIKRTKIGNDCYPSECDEPRYKLNGIGKSATCVEQKCEIRNAARTKWTGEKKAWKCIVQDCKNKYKKNDDSTACIEMLRECTTEQNAAHPNATQTGIKSGTETCIALECKCGYDLVNEKCVAWPATGKECTADTKPELPSHATGAIMKCNDKGKPYCEVSGCENNYTKNDSNTKCEKLRGECTHTDPNVKKAKYKKVDGNRICVITKCNDGYMPSDDGQKCEVSEGPCNETQLATIENATKGELKKGKCRATECKDGYEIEKHKCVEIAGNCPDKPENAKKSHREFDSNTQAEVCIIDECKDGYKVSDDGKSCIEIEKPKLSDEDQQKKIAELEENARAMKEKEQSTTNKLLGAAAIATAGQGLSDTMAASSESAADKEAEEAMRAYLATFRCSYAPGKNVSGGEVQVELPGGNDLIDLYSQYVNLANSLKVRKQALDMRPGIESETILDSAQTGLYDDIALGKTSGAYASLARALQDPNSEDAKMWAQQKEETASKKKSGMIMAGVGIIGGVAGNLLLNKNAPKERSDEINAKYESLKKLEETVAKIEPETTSCPSDATGTYPECECKDKTKKFYNPSSNVCETCTGNQIIQDDKCQCPSDKPLWDAQKTICIESPKQCTPQCTPAEGNHLQISIDCKCTCIDGYDLVNNQCVCQSPKEERGGQCIIVEVETKVETQNTTTTVNVSTTTETSTATLDAASLFRINSPELLTDAQKALDDFISDTEAENRKNCNIEIVGYTDPVGRDAYNQTLSENRAKAVADYINKKKGSAITNVTNRGEGENKCTCGTRGKKTINYALTDYKICKNKPDDTQLTGNVKFAPCRRVEIKATCDITTSTSSTQISHTSN